MPRTDWEAYAKAVRKRKEEQGGVKKRIKKALKFTKEDGKIFLCLLILTIVSIFVLWVGIFIADLTH